MPVSRGRQLGPEGEDCATQPRGGRIWAWSVPLHTGPHGFLQKVPCVAEVAAGDKPERVDLAGPQTHGSPHQPIGRCLASCAGWAVWHGGGGVQLFSPFCGIKQSATRDMSEFSPFLDVI